MFASLAIRLLWECMAVRQGNRERLQDGEGKKLPSTM